jgi:pilus assembly protein CpaC
MLAALMSRTVVFAALAAAATGAFAADNAVRPVTSPGFHSNVAQPTSVRQIRLPMSKSTIIDFDDDIRDILVSNPTVADAVVRSNRRLYVIGNKFGMTNIYVYGADNHQIANLEVQIEPDVSTLEQLLRHLQPQSTFHVEAVVGAVVLTGTVASPQDATQAYDVATKFLGAPDASGQPAAASASGSSNSVQVINGLAIKGKDQVMLRVTVAEVQRTALKSLGINLSASVSSGNFTTVLGSSNPFPINGVSSSGLTNSVGFKAGGTSVSGTLTAFEQNGLARVLSEPNLTAISGEEANFLVGGEYPIPVSQQNGVVTVDFKKYGIGLNFIPVVLSEGRISLKIATEVSEPTSTGSFTLGSSSTSSSLTISGLSVRRASSTVELSSGETMVMAGLLSDDVKQAMAGTPGLMNIPILGTLFRSRDFQRTQTELAVFVQPVIVQGVPAGKLVRPDQNFGVSSDAAAVFLGQLNRMYRAGDHAPTGSYHGQYGFIYE